MVQALEDPVQKLSNNVQRRSPDQCAKLLQLVHGRNAVRVARHSVHQKRPSVGLHGPNPLLHLDESLSLPLPLPPSLARTLAVSLNPQLLKQIPSHNPQVRSISSLQMRNANANMRSFSAADCEGGQETLIQKRVCWHDDKSMMVNLEP